MTAKIDPTLERDLRVLREAAAQLPDHRPPEDLFERSLRRWAADRAMRWRQRVLVAGTALAAAAVVLVLSWPSGTGSPPAVPRLPLAAAPADAELLHNATEEFRRAEEHYHRALQQLQRIAARESRRWDATRRQGYEQRLAGLGAVVDRCQHAARLAPADPGLQELLFAAYRRQIHYLRGAILSGIAVDEGLPAVDPLPVGAGETP